MKAKTNQRTKSILKNRNSQLFIQEDVNEENGYRLIDRLQNIDGKPIISEVSLNSINEKEVSFKKNMESSNGSFEQSIIPKGKRKSCLKRSSFDFYFSSL